VVAVVDIDPLRIAGGHSFETDLIEIAGGHSVTHPGEEHRVAIRADQWTEFAPDLVLFVSATEPPPGAEWALRSSLGSGIEVDSLRLDDAFWLGDAAEPARRLRSRIEALSRRMR